MNEIICVCGQRGTGKSTYLHDRIKGFKRIVVFDLLGETTQYETYKDMGSFLAALSEKSSKNFFSLNYYNPSGESEEEFEIICKAINRLENILFVVDEIDQFCSPSYIPQPLAEIIKRGRHQNLNLICATRRPHEINRLITSQLNELVTFRQVEPRDLDYLFFVATFDKEEVKGLQNFSYLRWREGQIERGKVSKPKTKLNNETQTRMKGGNV